MSVKVISVAEATRTQLSSVSSDNAKVAKNRSRKIAGVPRYDLPEMWQGNFTRRGGAH